MSLVGSIRQNWMEIFHRCFLLMPVLSGALPWVQWNMSLQPPTYMYIKRYTDHIRFKYELIQLLTPGITDCWPPDLRRQQSVTSLPSTTPLPRRACCLPLATYLCDIFGFILCYRSPFPCLPVSISLDTVLSFVYHIFPSFYRFIVDHYRLHLFNVHYLG